MGPNTRGARAPTRMRGERACFRLARSPALSCAARLRSPRARLGSPAPRSGLSRCGTRVGATGFAYRIAAGPGSSTRLRRALGASFSPRTHFVPPGAHCRSGRQLPIRRCSRRQPRARPGIRRSRQNFSGTTIGGSHAERTTIWCSMSEASRCGSILLAAMFWPHRGISLSTWGRPEAGAIGCRESARSCRLPRRGAPFSRRHPSQGFGAPSWRCARSMHWLRVRASRRSPATCSKSTIGQAPASPPSRAPGDWCRAPGACATAEAWRFLPDGCDEAGRPGAELGNYADENYFKDRIIEK